MEQIFYIKYKSIYKPVLALPYQNLGFNPDWFFVESLGSSFRIVTLTGKITSFVLQQPPPPVGHKSTTSTDPLVYRSVV